MQLRSDSFNDGDFIPNQYAFGKTSAEGKIDLADNKSPHLAWSDLPEGTQSIAILCIDSDAPTKPDDVNQEGRMVPSDLPRADFSHWVLVDVSPGASIAEGAFSGAFVPTIAGVREQTGDPAAFMVLNRVLSTLLIHVGMKASVL